MTQNKTVSEMSEEYLSGEWDYIENQVLKTDITKAFTAGFDAAIEMLRSEVAKEQDKQFTDKEEWSMTPKEWGYWLEQQKERK